MVELVETTAFSVALIAFGTAAFLLRAISWATDAASLHCFTAAAAISAAIVAAIVAAIEAAIVAAIVAAIKPYFLACKILEKCKNLIRTSTCTFAAACTFSIVNFWNACRKVDAVLRTFFCTDSAFETAGRTVFFDLHLVFIVA